MTAQAAGSYRKLLFHLGLNSKTCIGEYLMRRPHPGDRMMMSCRRGAAAGARLLGLLLLLLLLLLGLLGLVTTPSRVIII